MKARLCIGTILALLFLFGAVVIAESNFSIPATIGLIIADSIVGFIAAKIINKI